MCVLCVGAQVNACLCGEVYVYIKYMHAWVYAYRECHGIPLVYLSASPSLCMCWLYVTMIRTLLRYLDSIRIRARPGPNALVI